MSEYEIKTFRSQYDAQRMPYVAMHHLEMPDREARFAMELLERWSLVMADADGEDSAGRQKQRRMSVEETVQLACDTSEAAFTEFRKRGWMIQMPTLSEADEMAKAESDKDDN